MTRREHDLRSLDLDQALAHMCFAYCPGGRFDEGQVLAAPIEVRCIPAARGQTPQRSFHATPLEACVAAAKGAADRLNVTIGTAFRQDRSSGRKDNLHSARVLWADLDRKAGESLDDLTRRVTRFVPKPHLWTLSGGMAGGLHVYWRLRRSWKLDSPKRIRRLEAVTKAIASELRADMAATDASRTMRLAGSVNWPDPTNPKKQGRQPERCEIVRLEGHLGFTRSDFSALEEEGQRLVQERDKRKYRKKTWDGDLPRAVLRAARLDSTGRLQLLLDNPADVLREDSDESRVDWEIACNLASDGIDPADAEHALRWRRERHGEKSKSDSYFERTVERASAHAKVDSGRGA